MGIENRDYHRTDHAANPYGTGIAGPGSGSAVGAMRLWSVTTWLLVINIAVFVLDGAIRRLGYEYQLLGLYRGRWLPIDRMGVLEFWGYFSMDWAVSHLQLWRWVTFQFLHANLSHLLGNMIGLYFLGPMIEQWLGRRRFLAFYLICGVCGPLVYMLFAWVGVLRVSPITPLIGASAGVFGVLMAAALTAPREKIRLLFPPIPIELRTMAWVLLAIAVYTVFTQGYNAGGEAAHLGGAAAGYVLIRYPRYLNWAEPAWLKVKLAARRRARREAGSKMKYHGWR